MVDFSLFKTDNTLFRGAKVVSFNSLGLTESDILEAGFIKETRLFNQGSKTTFLKGVFVIEGNFFSTEAVEGINVPKKAKFSKLDFDEENF